MKAAALVAALAVLRGAAAQGVNVDVAARHLQPGELVVITFDAPPASDRPVVVRAFNRAITPFVDEDGKLRALVGIDLDVKPGTYRVTIRGAGIDVHRDLTVEPKTFRTRRLTVDPDFVTPPASVAERITQEAALLESTWRSSAPERFWSAGFVRPVKEPANSAFGTRSIFNGLPRNAHGGADFLSATGTPVLAPNAGRVVVARELYFSGNTVIVDHGLGAFSMLAHLSSIDVRESELVERAAIVGRVGATGRVTGPHLHWAMRINGSRVDPLSVLDLLGTP